MPPLPLAFRDCVPTGWAAARRRRCVVVAAHGLLGTKRNVGGLADLLAGGAPLPPGAPGARSAGRSLPMAAPTAMRAAPVMVRAVDLRNHGDSPHSPDSGLADLADDLDLAVAVARRDVEAAAAAAGDTEAPAVVLVAHSLGGMAALFALSRRANAAAIYGGAGSSISVGGASSQAAPDHVRGGAVDAVVILDQSPGRRPSTFPGMVQAVHHLTELPLAELATREDAVRWMREPRIAIGTPPLRFSSTALGGGAAGTSGPGMAVCPAAAAASISQDRPVLGGGGISDLGLAQYFATNLVPAPTGGLRWLPNIGVVAGAAADGSLLWERQFPELFRRHSGSAGSAVPAAVDVPTFFLFGGASAYFSPVAAQSIAVHFGGPPRVAGFSPDGDVDWPEAVRSLTAGSSGPASPSAVMDAVPGQGHFLHVFAPRAVAARIGAFLVGRGLVDAGPR